MPCIVVFCLGGLEHVMYLICTHRSRLFALCRSLALALARVDDALAPGPVDDGPGLGDDALVVLVHVIKTRRRKDRFPDGEIWLDMDLSQPLANAPPGFDLSFLSGEPQPLYVRYVFIKCLYHMSVCVPSYACVKHVYPYGASLCQSGAWGMHRSAYGLQRHFRDSEG